MKKSDVFTINGVTATAIEHAQRAGMCWQTAKNRVYQRGWNPHKALSAPPLSRSAAGKIGRKLSHWNEQPFLRGSLGRNPE